MKKYPPASLFGYPSFSLVKDRKRECADHYLGLCNLLCGLFFLVAQIVCNHACKSEQNCLHHHKWFFYLSSLTTKKKWTLFWCDIPMWVHRPACCDPAPLLYPTERSSLHPRSPITANQCRHPTPPIRDTSPIRWSPPFRLLHLHLSIHPLALRPSTAPPARGVRSHVRHTLHLLLLRSPMESRGLTVTPQVFGSHKLHFHRINMCIIDLNMQLSLETCVCNIINCVCFIRDCLWIMVRTICRCNMSSHTLKHGNIVSVTWQAWALQQSHETYETWCCNKVSNLIVLLFQLGWYLEVGVTNV
jgi:hypothetical protein